MAATRAAMLTSFVDYLNSVDVQIGTLLRANQAQLARARFHIDDSLLQSAKRGREGPTPARENGSFLGGDLLRR